MGVQKFKCLVIAVITSCGSLMAQNDCQDALYKASNLYEAGQVGAAIELLEPCLAKQKGKTAKFEAYRLLAQAHLDQNQTEKATEYATNMLKEEPRYKRYPNNDPAELTALLDKMVVEEKWYLGGFGNISVNQVKLIQSYSLINEPQGYMNTLGFSYGLLVGYHFNSHFSLEARAGYQGLSVQHRIESQFEWTKEYNDQLRAQHISLGMFYRYPVGNLFNLHTGIQGGISNLFQSQVVVETNSTFTNSTELVTKDGIDDKNASQWFLGVNAGISKPLERGEIGLDVSYNWYLSNLSKSDTRFSDTDFIFSSGYVNDDVSLRMLVVGLHYTLPVAYKIHSEN